MRSDKVIGKVYETKDLNQFKYLDSNRDLKNRVSRVKKSIEEYGWINSPILCNEKMEVIDGQARLQACKELKIGLTYVIINGLGIKHCRVLNSINSNWDYMDYIKSYADSGDNNYKYIHQICVKMKNEWGKAPTKVLSQIAGSANGINKIVAGEAKMTTEEYNDACRYISYMTPFVKMFKEFGIASTSMLSGMYYASRKMPDYAKTNLLAAFEKRLNSLSYKPPGNVRDALEIIDDIYNYRRKKELQFKIVRVYEDEGLYTK